MRIDKPLWRKDLNPASTGFGAHAHYGDTLMKARSLFAERTALFDQATAIAPVPSGGMRDALRDTALLVTNLTTGGRIESFNTLRNRCKELVLQFGNTLKGRGYGDDLCDDAVIAQCALLDEAALSNLSAEDRDRWSLEPLQVETFNQHDAGERVFERLEVRMRERTPQIDLLECYAAVLGLGFVGRYAIDKTGKRETLIAELNALLTRLQPAETLSFVIDQRSQSIGGWFRRLSPWAAAGIGCLIAFAVWLAWHMALDAQLAVLAPHTIKP
jgi:type VI secretion system protein ImpK